MEYTIRGLSLRYGERTALKEVSCTLKANRWISVIGPSGAGKTTFALLLKGLLPGYEGECLIDGEMLPNGSASGQKPLSRVGLVFQYPEQQLFETTVYRELAFAPRLQRWEPGRIKEAIEDILPLLGLDTALLELAPFQLSGGQKRRVALASVLLMEPELLVLDEPTAGLDPEGSAALLNLLRIWLKQGKRTIVFISHSMEDVAEYSDEVLLFDGGRLLAHEEADELFLRRSAIWETCGLPLPEPVQLLRLVERLSGTAVHAASCREEQIMDAVLPLLQARGAK